MTPKLVCRNCGNEVESSDKFCSSCGASIEWSSVPPRPVEDPKTKLTCSLCGQRNDPAGLYCESCGAAIGGPSPLQAEKSTPSSRPSHKPPRLKVFQSWKLTLGLAILLAATLVILKSTRNDRPGSGGGLSPHAAGMVQEIQTLQSAVESNPRDAASILRLANLYHDVRLFPKAISTYERYLGIDPSNADARVDLGTSYFELSFEDTTRRTEYLTAAKEAMEKALTYVPRHQLALFNLGIVRFHTGEVDDALDSFRRCIAVDSTSATGRKALQFLSQHSSINPSS